MRPYTAAEKRQLTIRINNLSTSFDNPLNPRHDTLYSHHFAAPKPFPLCTFQKPPFRSYNPCLFDLELDVINRSSSTRLSAALILPAFPHPKTNARPISRLSIPSIPYLGAPPPPQSRFTLPSPPLSVSENPQYPHPHPLIF